MMKRRWIALVAGLIAPGGPAVAEDPAPKPAPYELTCWQGGQPVIREAGIAQLPPDGLPGLVFRKPDGSSLILLDTATHALCLLRRPGGL